MPRCDLLREYPWLAEYFQPPGGDVHDDVVDDGAGDIVAEDDIFFWEASGEAWAEVAAACSEPSHDICLGEADFFMRMRAGGWGGDATDTIATEAGKGGPRAFAKKYGLNQSMTFRIGQMTDVDATILAGEWCSKMSHFYRIYAGQPDPNYVFTDDDRVSYRSCGAFIDLSSRADVSETTRTKATVIHLMSASKPNK